MGQRKVARTKIIALMFYIVKEVLSLCDLTPTPSPLRRGGIERKEKGLCPFS
ncbi:MAG: hypothetical protein V1767_06300 [Chloroflexota bacterium]